MYFKGWLILRVCTYFIFLNEKKTVFSAVGRTQGLVCSGKCCTPATAPAVLDGLEVNSSTGRLTNGGPGPMTHRDLKLRKLSLIFNIYSKFTHVKTSVMSTKFPGV